MNCKTLRIAVAVGPYGAGSTFLSIKRIAFRDATIIMDTMNLAVGQRNVLSLVTDTPVTDTKIQVTGIIKYDPGTVMA